jgi:hypothetical protein
MITALLETKSEFFLFPAQVMKGCSGMSVREFIRFESFALIFSLVLGAQTANAALIFDHPNPQAGANFGTAIAEVGDVNGDGTPDLLIGAPLQDVEGSTDQGQAYVISGADGTLLLTLNDPNPQADAHFGSALAGTGDIDGDGNGDFLVGAPGKNVGACGKFSGTDGCSVGQAFVFSGSDGSLLWTLNHPTPSAGSFFGSAVASHSDLTGDSIPELIIGAPGQYIGVFVPSQAFVFNGKTGDLLLTFDDPNGVEVESLVGQTFGSVVASVGDLGGTVASDILIGDAQQDVGGNTDQGQVSVFSGDGGNLLITLNHPVPQENGLFGASANSIGDVNGDTIPDLIVGAPGQTVAENFRQGQAYVMSGETAALLFTLDNPTPQADAKFGFAVAPIGDINGDTVPDVIVAAPRQNVGGNLGQGQVYVFSGFDGTLLATLDNPNPQTDAGFGYAVVSGGDLDADGIPDPVIGALFQDVSPNPLQGQVSSPAPALAEGNQTPTADAGADQTVNSGSLINLNGSASSDPDEDPITFSWTQTAGSTVALSNAGSPTPTFTTPQVTSDTVLTFELVVADDQGNSDSDSVNVTVLNSADGPDLAGEFTAVQSDPLSITFLVKNIGTETTTEGFTVKFFLSEDETLDGSDSQVYKKTIKVKGSKGTIQPGGSLKISKTLKLSGQGKVLIAFVDSNNSIAETNEENNITVATQLAGDPPTEDPPSEDPPSEEPPTTNACTTKVQAMTLKYTGPDIFAATLEIKADKFKNSLVIFSGIDLPSGTILTSLAENGFSIDATAHNQNELGGKTKIRINGVEEALQTDCSTPFEAGKPAPLSKPKGDPSPNWFVVKFTQK